MVTKKTRTEAGVWFSQCKIQGQINLKGDPSEPAFIEGVKKVFGFKLPTHPNTSAKLYSPTCEEYLLIMCLGPGEWLVIIRCGTPRAVMWELSKISSVSGTDVTDGSVIFGLSGRHARDVLMKGCAIDLHSKSFRTNDCTRTLLAEVGIILYLGNALTSSGDEQFQIWIPRSYGRYLGKWIEDASSEYGIEVLQHR